MPEDTPVDWSRLYQELQAALIEHDGLDREETAECQARYDAAKAQGATDEEAQHAANLRQVELWSGSWGPSS